MPEMRIVKFNQGYQKYNKDETAGFPVDIANRLCQQNRDTGKSIATLVGDGTPEPTPEPGLNGPRAEAAIPGLNLGPLVEVVKGQQEQIAQLTQAVTQQSRAVGKLIEAIMQQNERERGSR